VASLETFGYTLVFVVTVIFFVDNCTCWAKDFKEMWQKTLDTQIPSFL
jgi:hypothetical protein